MYFPLNETKQGKVIGIRVEKDGSRTYTVEPLTVTQKPLTKGKIIRFNSKDVDKKELIVEIIKNKEQMEDTDLMPFGKFSKKPDGPQMMANVPARYLSWLGQNAKAGVRKTFPQVFTYIRDNKDVINQEIENCR